MRLYNFFDHTDKLQGVVDSDAWSNELAIQIEAIVGAIETMVIAGEAKAESSGESISSSPSDTRTQADCPTRFVDQAEITCQIHKQGEFLSDGATNVTNIRLKAQIVCCSYKVR